METSPRIRVLLVALAAPLPLAFSARPAAAQTIVNAGFETPNVGAGNFQYTPSGVGVGWNFSGSSGVTGNSSGFTSGNPGAPEGAQVGFLQLGGSFSQTITLAATDNYSLSFFAAQRGAGGGTQPSTQDFSVSIAGTTLGNFQPSSAAYSLYTTDSIFLTAGSYFLNFQGLNSASAADVTVFVDDVRINAVSTSAPEPGSFAFLLAGVGIAARIRRPRG